MGADSFFFLRWCEFKAAKLTYHKFGVHRHGLALLAGMAAYLQIHNRRAVGHVSLFAWFGYGPPLKAKSRGYIEHLIQYGCIHRLNYRCHPDAKGNSYALSQFGAVVLEFYYDEVARLERQFRHGLKNPSFKVNAVNTTNIADQLPRYIIVKTGKD